jgi:hypothetical protein
VDSDVHAHPVLLVCNRGKGRSLGRKPEKGVTCKKQLEVEIKTIRTAKC